MQGTLVSYHPVTIFGILIFPFDLALNSIFGRIPVCDSCYAPEIVWQLYKKRRKITVPRYEMQGGNRWIAKFYNSYKIVYACTAF